MYYFSYYVVAKCKIPYIVRFFFSKKAAKMLTYTVYIGPLISVKFYNSVLRTTYKILSMKPDGAFFNHIIA
jgi:hypothetical protein